MVKKRDIFRRVMWFDKREQFDLDFLYDLLQPRRKVSSDARYKSGSFYSEKCARQIQYESGLERDFYHSLEASGRVRFYCEQPVRIPVWKGKIKRGYTPDCLSYLATGEIIITEVKPLSEMLDSDVQAKTEALMEFCSERGFGLLLTDGTHTPKDLLKGKVNRKLEKELLTALETNPVRRTEFREIMKRCEATESEFLRAVIRHDLKLSSKFPRFKLSRGNQSPVFRQVYFGKKRYDAIIKNRPLSYSVVT